MKTIYRNLNKLWALMLIIVVQTASAQQDAMYTQYMYNIQAVNAAYPGSKDYMDITILNRNQWVGFEGAPVTQNVTVLYPFRKYNLGLGLSYVRDKIGPVVKDNFYLDVAYRIKVHQGGWLSMGAKGGFDVNKVNMTELKPLDQNDPSYYSDAFRKLQPNFGAGLFYYTKNYYFGLSTPKLARPEVIIDPTGNGAGDKVSRHYYFIGGYVWEANPDWKIKPTYFLRFTKDAPVSMDLTVNAMYKEKVIGGLAYRFRESIAAILMFSPTKKLWIGYAFDFSTTAMFKNTAGSHEIMLNYEFLPPKYGIVKSPRFF